MKSFLLYTIRYVAALICKKYINKFNKMLLKIIKDNKSTMILSFECYTEI